MVSARIAATACRPGWEVVAGPVAGPVAATVEAVGESAAVAVLVAVATGAAAAAMVVAMATRREFVKLESYYGTKRRTWAWRLTGRPNTRAQYSPVQPSFGSSLQQVSWEGGVCVGVGG